MPERDASTIDLGTYRYDQDHAAGEKAAEPAPGHRARRAAVRRWALPAAVLLVLPLAGAAAPAEPALELLWSVPAAQPAGDSQVVFAVDGDHLYLATADQDSGDREWTLAGFGVVDGRVRWRLPLAGSNPPTLWPAGPTLVVHTSGRDGQSATTGYDAATGRQRWTRPEDVFQVDGDDLMLLMGRTFPEPHPDELFGGEMELIPVEPGTGRDTGGTLRVGAHDRLQLRATPGDGTDLFTLARDGVLTRYDVATGETVAIVDTPHRERDTGATQNQLEVGDGLVLVGARGGDAPPAVSAYDAETLAHRWDAPVAAGAPRRCGPVLCVTARSGGTEGLHGLDPATGGIRWTVSCADAVAPEGVCLGLGAHPLPSGHLWVEWSFVETGPADEPREWTTAQVVDATTGRPQSTATRWGLPFPWDGPGLLLTLREPVPGPAADGGAEPSPPRIWWARASADLTGLDVLGTTGAAWSCRTHWPYLVCEDERELTVWRVDGRNRRRARARRAADRMRRTPPDARGRGLPWRPDPPPSTSGCWAAATTTGPSRGRSPGGGGPAGSGGAGGRHGEGSRSC